MACKCSPSGGRETRFRTNLAALALRFGDALLLQGSRERIRRLAADPDFVVLSQTAQAPRRVEKAPFALAGLVLMIGLVVSGWQPIHCGGLFGGHGGSSGGSTDDAGSLSRHRMESPFHGGCNPAGGNSRWKELVLPCFWPAL